MEEKICYNHFSGSPEKNMRIALRFLAVLTIAALLAPGVPWTSLRASVEGCPCAPAVCRCAHHHADGHLPGCSMGKSGQCGLESHDSYLSSILSTLIYVPSEQHWASPLAPLSFGHETSDSNLLPSHRRIPEQPPRPTLCFLRVNP